MGIIGSLFALGFNLIFFFFRIMLAFIVGIVLTTKGRSGLLWGVATFIFPWIAFIAFFMPVKTPKIKSYLMEKPEFRGKNPAIAALMALTAVIAKADGHVSQEEVNIIKQYITANFRISRSELATYQGVFDYGKNHADEYKEYVRILKTYYQNRQFILSVSYLLMTICLHDGKENDHEISILKQVIVELGLSEYEFQSIKRYFSGQFNGYGQSSYGSSQYGGAHYGGAHYARVDNSHLVDKYSKVLGVDPNADLTTLKKAYRKKAKEYHPDKMASKGMPEDYMQYAHEQTAEINEAYEFLKKHKENNQTAREYS